MIYVYIDHRYKQLYLYTYCHIRCLNFVRRSLQSEKKTRSGKSSNRLTRAEMGIRDYIESKFNNFQPRIVCVFIGIVELLFVIGYAWFSLAVEENEKDRAVFGPVAMIESVIVPCMLAGTFMENRFLLWPYVIVKFSIVLFAAFLFVLAIFFKFSFDDSRVGKSQNRSADRINWMLDFGFLCLILNLFPLVIVRKYYRELVERKRQTDVAYF